MKREEGMEEQQSESQADSYLSQKMFSFSKPSFRANKLIDKHVPSVAVNTQKGTVKCVDGDSQVSVIRTTDPLPNDHLIAFFEVKYKNLDPSDDGLNVGFITKDGNPRSYIGRYNNSVGYDSGDVYLNKKKVASFPKFEAKWTRYGCGVNFSNMSFFFTRNNELIVKNIVLEDSKWSSFYPAVALKNTGQQVEVFFEVKDFKFDILKYSQEVERQVSLQICQQQRIQTSDIYSLLSEYMLFNGYSKTYEMMNSKAKELGMKPSERLTKRNALSPKIDLQYMHMIKEEEERIINMPLYSEEKSEMLEEEQMEIEQGMRFRDRIMSDVNPDLEFGDFFMAEDQISRVRRKNTENIEDLNIPQDQQRKLSNISNVSQVDEREFEDYHKRELKLAEPKEKTLSLNEQFLLKERVEVLDLIRDRKIELAEKILKSKVSKIYQLEPLLESYFQAHIFLRKIKEEGGIAAITYARKETHLSENQERLFPTYNPETKKREQLALKKIFNAVPKAKNKEEHFLLRREQFECLAQFVNRAIVSSMGMMGDSRLGVSVEHVNLCLRKLKEFNGVTCGISLNI